MNWYIRRERQLYRPRGFGLYWEGGCLGSTYGEPGTDHFFSVTIFFWWQWRLQISWKRLPPLPKTRRDCRCPYDDCPHWEDYRR